MKTARKIFAILFLILFGIYSFASILFHTGDLISAAVAGLPSYNGVVESTNYTALHSLPGRTFLLERHAQLQLLLGKTESGGLDVIATSGNSYVNGHSTAPQSYLLEQYAMKLNILQKNLQDADLDTVLMFISTQPQVVNGFTNSVSGLPLPNETSLMEGLLYYLRGYHVDFVDTSGVLNQSALDLSEYVYRTDNHWTTQASFIIMQTIEGKLADSYELAIDPQLWDEANYHFTVYEDAFLGDLGMAAGEPFTGKEDFTAITPSYQTNFIYEAQGDSFYSSTGNFEKTLFDAKTVHSQLPYTYNSYSSYLNGGLFYWRKITNQNNLDGSNVLYIHDSSSLPLAALLAPAFGETHMYNPRLAPNSFSFDLFEYIQENNIDFVFFQSESNMESLSILFSVLD